MYVETYHTNPIQVHGKLEIKRTRARSKETDTKSCIKGKNGIREKK